MKLSIILPCYNVGKYLKRSISSIYSQNVSFLFEVIAVDDGSTDNTLEILELLAKEYDNLRVIRHKNNQKLTGARTTGMMASRGEYIMHLDPDDYLINGNLKDLFLRNPGNWDILSCNIEDESPNGVQLRFKNEYPKITNISNLDRGNKFLNLIIEGSCFGKIIRKDLIRDLCYFDYHYNMGEDKAFNYEVFSKASIIAFDDTPIVRYCYNPSSLDRGAFNVEILDIKNNWVSNIMAVEANIAVNPMMHEIFKKKAERYIIGMLNKIRKQQERSEIFAQWKRFFNVHSSLFGKKVNLYNIILRIRPNVLSIFLLLVALGQIDPYIERYYRIFHSK